MQWFPALKSGYFAVNRPLYLEDCASTTAREAFATISLSAISPASLTSGTPYMATISTAGQSAVQDVCRRGGTVGQCSADQHELL